MSTQKVLIIIPRENSGDSFYLRLRFLLKKDNWSRVIILSLKPDDTREQCVVDRLRHETDMPMDVLPIRTIQELKEGVSQGSFVLSQRYHGALAALALGIPFDVVAQSAEDKLAGLPSFVGREGECVMLIENGRRVLAEVLSLSSSIRPI